MKTSRNDPCPCGSGKKYKQCCLNRQAAATSPQDLAWRRLRHAMEGFPSRMLQFVDHAYGVEALDEAWEEFVLWDECDEGFDPETPHQQAFMPWFFHKWAPDPDETDVADPALHGVPPTRAYLAHKGRHLDPIVRDYLQSCLAQPFSFFEVERVTPGHDMVLRDVLTGALHETHEASASRSVQPHDLLFGQVAMAGGVTLLEATCGVVLPPGDKADVVELRMRIRAAKAPQDEEDTHMGADRLADWDCEIRQLYLDLADARWHPVRPQVLTPEGDEFEFHKLIFDIASPQPAFDAIRPLAAWGDDDEAMEGQIERDADGRMVGARIDLLRPGQRNDGDAVSLLGSVRIEGRRMTVEVSSRERAEWIKRHFTSEALGIPIALRTDTIQTLEQALAEHDAGAPRTATPSEDEPEVQAVILKTLLKHYLRWVDTPIPALGQRTPRQVATTSDGREQVTALLHDAERQDIGLSAASRKQVFDAVRAEIGLPSR